MMIVSFVKTDWLEVFSIDIRIQKKIPEIDHDTQTFVSFCFF